MRGRIIALSVVIFVVVVTLAITLSSRFRGQKMYACKNGQCVTDPHGAYLDSSCGHACEPVVPKFSCLRAKCMPDNTNGTFTTSTCNDSCIVDNVVITALPAAQCNWLLHCENAAVNVQVYINGRVLSAAAKIHGHSSSSFPQKSINLKFSSVQQLFDFPYKTDKMILYAPAYEGNKVQEPLTYLVSNSIGLRAVDTYPVVLWVNPNGTPTSCTVPVVNPNCAQGGDACYRGLYWLTNTIDERLLGIAKTDCIIEFDRGDCPSDHATLLTKYSPFGLDIAKEVDSRPMLQYPKPTSAILDATGSLLLTFVTSLFTGQGDIDDNVLDMIDADSWAKYFIMSEFACSTDAYVYSTYLTIRGGKIFMGPLSDYNFAYGDWLDRNGSNVYFWRYVEQYLFLSQKSPQPAVGVASMYCRLLMSTKFQDYLMYTYTKLRTNELSTATIDAVLDTLCAVVEPGMAAYYQRWPAIPSCTPALNNTYAASKLNLQNWISIRLAWMDANMVPGAPVDSTGTNGAAMFELPFKNGGCYCNLSVSVKDCEVQKQKGFFYSYLPYMTKTA